MLIDPSEVAMHDEDYHIITEICYHNLQVQGRKDLNYNF